ncbi:Uncharacterised protein [uncultured Clostridium sp.]
MENQLIYQPIHVGEVYANKNLLYRVESIDGECLRPSAHLRRLADGWEVDVTGAALYRTDRGIELLWQSWKNGHFVPERDAV